MMGVPYDAYAPYDPRAPPPTMDEGRKGGGYDVKGGNDEGLPAMYDPVYEYPVPLQIRNTFLEMAGRSPSFDEFMEERKVKSSPAAYDPYDPGDEVPPSGYDARALRPRAGGHFHPGQRHVGGHPSRPSASNTRDHRFDDHQQFVDDHNRDRFVDDHFENHHDSYRHSMPTNSAALTHQLVHGLPHESLEPMMIGSYSSADRSCQSSSAPAWRIPGGQRPSGRHQRQDGSSNQHSAPHQQPQQPPASRWIDPPDQSPDFAAHQRTDGASSLPMSTHQRSSGLDHPRHGGSLHLNAPVADEPPEEVSSDDDGSEQRINSQTAELGSIGCPTVGSRGHSLKMCKPCAFSGKGCQSGMNCTFCHLCEVGEKKRRKKEKVAFRRELQKMRQIDRASNQGRVQDKGAPGQQSDPRQLGGHQQSRSSPVTPSDGGTWSMGNFW